MNRALYFLIACLLVVGLATAAWSADPTTASAVDADYSLAQIYRIPRIPGPVPLPRIPPKGLLFKWPGPDLTVSISGPARAIPGESIALTVTVRNKGRVSAVGTQENSQGGYMVDLVLSQDTNIPPGWAVQPVYAGKTEDDFVEDMLILGGRISNTQTVAPGGTATYNLPAYIPKYIDPDIYCLAAVVDPGDRIFELIEGNNIYCHRLQIGATADPDVEVPDGVGMWIMPYGVGGTSLDRIKPNGLTDYAGMTNAPFGGRLGFRLGHDQRIPSARFRYYRWLYRPQGTTEWQEFTEPVKVHYVREQGGEVSFPVLVLGPESVGGRQLYRFRPHLAPAEPGANTYWPTANWFGDIYTGFLRTPQLNDGLYQIRLEIFNGQGSPMLPGPNTFRFIVPTGVGPDETILTEAATPTGGGFVFNLRIDNRHCGAFIEPPAIGTSTVADKCGFLLYGSDTDEVRILFRATHPADFAYFRFRIIRGINEASLATGEVNATSAGDYTGDGHGNFNTIYEVRNLLGDCPQKAAFSENLYVYAKATTGWGHRISAYDASFVRAFALAPTVTATLVPLLRPGVIMPQ